MRIQPDLNELKIGETAKLTITRDPHHMYIIPDAPMAGRNIRGQIEMSLLSFQQQITDQAFERLEGDGPMGVMVSGPIGGEPRIIELATVRFSKEVALDTVGVLAQHLMQHHGVSKAELDEHINSQISATEAE